MNINQLNRPIRSLFYVFGFGWVNDAPEQVYVVPARELYDYNKDTGQVTFPAKESESEKLERLKRFKRKDNRCLMYIDNTSVKIYRTKKLNNGSRVTGSAI